ncbi:cytochrome c-type biogenesis protein [Delftia tsuruhatensis]|uniref:cytochrome c-type biogenesis protein n=1 Tax=Delftia tsuruhatensis TaxID=180282 RepID=UPI0025CD278B|nr:cytochrome c-type biogenesis protein [uncultured Acidovorax sp.]
MKRWLFAAICCAFATAWAGTAVPMAQNPETERRMAEISTELRCLVCQNESIAASRADLAVDLRRQIREQIESGKNDKEILAYMVDRYGDFVRYRPPVKGTTLLLWFGPAVLLVVSLIALLQYLRRRSSNVDDLPLSNEDRRRAEGLLTNNRDVEP